VSGQASLNLGRSEILSHENSPNNPGRNAPLNQPEPPGHDAHATAQEDPWAFWRSVLITLAVALGIRQFLVEARYIPSGSMLPGLQLQDRLLVEKLSFR
jgi:signal peptidase I